MQFTAGEINLLKDILQKEINLEGISISPEEKEELVSAFNNRFAGIVASEQETFELIRLSLKLTMWKNKGV